VHLHDFTEKLGLKPRPYLDFIHLGGVAQGIGQAFQQIISSPAKLAIPLLRSKPSVEPSIGQTALVENLIPQNFLVARLDLLEEHICGERSG